MTADPENERTPGLQPEGSHNSTDHSTAQAPDGSAPDKPTPSVDAEYLADRLTWNEWEDKDIKALVEGVQSIAYAAASPDDGPGFNVEKVMDGLLGALNGITDHLDGIDAQIEMERHAADERIVEVIMVPQPITQGDRAIVGWAITADGGTRPVATTATDPTPRVHHRSNPTGAQ